MRSDGLSLLLRESSQAHGSLANFLWAAGELAEAETEFKAAFAIEPNLAGGQSGDGGLLSQPEPRTGGRALPEVLRSAERDGRCPAAACRPLPSCEEGVRGDQHSLASDGGAGGFVQATLRLAALDFFGDRRPEAYKRIDAVLQREPRNESALEAQSSVPAGRTEESGGTG